ncbi:hypothetical protein L1987_78356 [Smallanthus sonchifolius]|uniref:Uncharacterized protein n=1 Tax=Smallanthus sonchifolius TaxID=185202 RepID=A0ACB8ZCF7_9ASTR|nr:hypothetical protein L1987_78356 [Smallanthus sonchifolius]
MHPSSAFSLLILFTIILSTTTTNAHNITRILEKNHEFSTFNHYLTLTHLAGEINRRQTITVCAVDNAAMSTLIAKGLSLETIKNVLSLHVFADYYGTKKLHQITKGSTSTATMYQATGEAPGTTGFVNITDVKGGKVQFTPEDNPSQTDVVYVKSILEMPYNISVIQISQILSSPEAEAPTSAPDLNLTSLLQRDGCKAFYDLLLTSGAIGTFLSTVDGGVTVFCPSDDAVKSFAPKYENLTAEGKTSLLLYHGVPIYNSMGMLRSSNGLMNTLATEGANKYDFTVQNDVAIYRIDKVLMPRELLKGLVVADEPAPAPKGAKKKASKKGEDAGAPGPDSSNDYGDDGAAVQKANSGGKLGASVVMALFLVVAFL